MRIEIAASAFLSVLHHTGVTRKMPGNKNGQAINAQPVFNSQVRLLGRLSQSIYGVNKLRQIAGALPVSLLLDESVVCP
jgi:hypothetical protein